MGSKKNTDLLVWYRIMCNVEVSWIGVQPMFWLTCMDIYELIDNVLPENCVRSYCTSQCIMVTFKAIKEDRPFSCLDATPYRDSTLLKHL